MSPKEIDQMMNKKSGFLGLAGTSRSQQLALSVHERAAMGTVHRQ
jgi:acetate kinase